MKANELRIGNLVVCDAIDTHKDRMPYFGKYIHAVHSACVDFVKLELGDGAIQKVEIFAIKPVELTKEWLLKFGFVEEFENKFHKNSIAIEIFENECIVYLGDFVDLAIKYVHQLQNLYFALTVEELAVA